MFIYSLQATWLKGNTQVGKLQDMAVFLSKHFDFWTLARCDSWAEEVVCLGKMSFLCMCKRVLHVHVLMIQNNMALHPLSCFWVSVPSLPYHHISVYSALALTHIPLPVPYTDWEVGVEEGEKMTNEDLKQKKNKKPNRPAQFRLSYIQMINRAVFLFKQGRMWF